MLFDKNVYNLSHKKNYSEMQWFKLWFWLYRQFYRLEITYLKCMYFSYTEKNCFLKYYFWRGNFTFIFYTTYFKFVFNFMV